MGKTPIAATTDQEVEQIRYELDVLSRMVEQLPPNVCVLFMRQLSKLIDAFVARDIKFSKIIADNVDDTALQLKLMEFDLEATKKERDNLQKLLDQY